MQNKLILRTPASFPGDVWREALPLGNGEVGGLVYGGALREILAVTHAALWWHSVTQPLPDIHEKLPLQRALLKEGKIPEAERVMTRALLEQGYRPENGIPLPLCDILLQMQDIGAFRHYRRILAMDEGEATVRFDGNGHYLRRAFISRADGLVYLHLQAQDAPLSFLCRLDRHERDTVQTLPEPENQSLSATVQDGAGLFCFAADKAPQDAFGGVLCLRTDGELCAESQPRPTDTTWREGPFLSVRNATEATLILSVFPTGKREAEWEKARAQVLAAPDYETAKAAHLALHRPAFLATEFDLGSAAQDTSDEELLLQAYDGDAPAELYEKLWAFGRYLLLSSSRPGGLPCPLYGLWAGSWNAYWPWNMFNVNAQMMYWQALSGNLADCEMAMFDYLDAMLPDLRENARKLYGCRGIFLSSVNTPESGLHKNPNPHILHYTGAAGWMAQHYYDYYLTTGDEAFLRQRALPFLYEVALFYEDFVQKDEDGALLFSPSCSPENHPRNVLATGCYSQVAVNSTMDVAICKEVLTNLLEGCAITGQYAEKWDTWRTMLRALPPYRINRDGALREWLDARFEDNYEHRHQSHLYPAFPGTEITQKSRPELFRACQVAMEKRRVVGLKDQSGWSLTYMANVFARLGQGETALECLGYLTRSNLLSNFFTVHNDWRRMGVAMCNDNRVAPVQIDANMGFTAAMQEMAVSSARGEISAFHAFPAAWQQGHIGPLSTRVGCEVTLTFTPRGGAVTLRRKNGEGEILLSLGSSFRFPDGSDSRTLALSAGAELTLPVIRAPK